MDVTDDSSVQSVIDHIIEEESHIDLLINNAGITCSGEHSREDYYV